MAIRKNYIGFVASCLSCLALMTACSVEEREQPISAGKISVYTSISRSGDAVGREADGLKACLLFWQESDYHNILNEEMSVEPFLISMPNEKINYYNVQSGVPYNTFQSYPLGDRLLHVCGFAPSSLVSYDSYKTLIIPKELQDGKTDFLSGDGNRYRVGKSSEPFVMDVKDDDYVAINQLRQLEFCHLTSKIVITAKRSEKMLGRIGVRGINVTLYGQKVPVKLKWKQITETGDDDFYGYFPQESIGKDLKLAYKYNDPLIQTMEQRVDSCYVLANGEHFHPSETTESESGEIRMLMDITAELIPVVNGAYDYGQISKETWKGVEVVIKSKTGTQLKMGYKYEIAIIFDVSGIRLQGIELEWDEGGLHFIPITPNPDKETN